MDESTQKSSPEINKDIIKFFDTFLKPGIAVVEGEVRQGLHMTIKALTAGELIIAESLIKVHNPNTPYDIIAKIRGAAILSQAILKLGDMEIDRSDMSLADNRIRRENLYTKLLEFPPSIISDAYELYLKAVQKQNEFFDKPAEMKEKIENF